MLPSLVPGLFARLHMNTVIADHLIRVSTRETARFVVLRRL
jgi:hypothetical protein